MNNILKKPEIIVKTFRKKINLTDIFANTNPIWLEIGFGVGDFLLVLAKGKPDTNFLGIELDQYRYFKMREKIIKNALTNLLIINTNASLSVKYLFEKKSIDKIFINFPDPWPKNRHWKNRLFTMDFIDSLTDIMKPKALLRIQTDVLSYSKCAEKFLNINDSLRKTEKFLPAVELPKTTFECRFIKLGLPIYRLIYEKKT